MNRKQLISLVSFLGLGLAVVPELQAVRLLGMYNNLTRKGKIKAPRVEIIDDPARIQKADYITPTAAGMVHPVDVALPAYLNITYDTTINQGEPFTVVIRDTGKTGNCPGNKSIVEVAVKGDQDSAKTVCVSKAVSDILGTRADRWQNVMLALGNNPDYVPGEMGKGKYPFVFGLSAWSSSTEPWHRTKVSATADKQVSFATPLRVIQGHTAFGGGSVPRFGHGSIAHFYNDSPYVILMERAHLDKRFAGQNFKEIIPPMSAVPLGMAWIPKIAAKDKGNLQKSALQIHAMGAPTVGLRVPPAPTAFAYIFKAGTEEIGAAPISTEEIEDFVESLSSSNPDQTAELLGEEPLDTFISDNYANYYISKYYFKIYTVAEEKRIYVERCKLGTDECTVVKSYDAPAYTAAGTPNYFKLVIKKDTRPEKENTGITLDITQVPKKI